MTAFSFGWILSASTAARAKNGRKLSFTPSRAWKSALARSRSRAILVTSASTTVVSCADTFSDSTMWRAIDWRVRDIFSVVPRRRAAAAGAWEGAGGVDRAAGACAAGAGAWACVVGACVCLFFFSVVAVVLLCVVFGGR